MNANLIRRLVNEKLQAGKHGAACAICNGSSSRAICNCGGGIVPGPRGNCDKAPGVNRAPCTQCNIPRK